MRQGTVQRQGGKGIRDWTRQQHVLALCGHAWLVKVFVHGPLNLRCCPHETAQETPVSAVVQEPPGTRRPPLAQLRGGAGLSAGSRRVSPQEEKSSNWTAALCLVSVCHGCARRFLLWFLKILSLCATICVLCLTAVCDRNADCLHGL